ncbi:hypothetical protein HDU76_001480 [Blyttiomyces sp. JEL0837]|nr:hypothetical protein HDU76_001480 [Blyttiomyces sp. JEL0837]
MDEVMNVDRKEMMITGDEKEIMNNARDSSIMVVTNGEGFYANSLFSSESTLMSTTGKETHVNIPSTTHSDPIRRILSSDILLEILEHLDSSSVIESTLVSRHWASLSIKIINRNANFRPVPPTQSSVSKSDDEHSTATRHQTSSSSTINFSTPASESISTGFPFSPLPSSRSPLTRLTKFLHRATGFPNMLQTLRSIDLTGIEILPPHATDAWFESDSQTFKYSNAINLSKWIESNASSAPQIAPSSPPVTPSPVSQRITSTLATSLIQCFPYMSRLSCLKLRSIDFAFAMCLVGLLGSAEGGEGGGNDKSQSRKRAPLTKLEILKCHVPPATSQAAVNLSQSLVEMGIENALLVQSLGSLVEFGLSTCGGRGCGRCAGGDSVIMNVLKRIGCSGSGSFGKALKRVKFGEAAWFADDMDTAEFVSRCPNVNELWMTGTTSPFQTPASFQTIFQAWSLTVVNFAYYTEVDDTLVQLLIQNSQNLTALNLNVVTYDSITDATITKLTNHPKLPTNLKSLILHPAARFSERVLLSLFQRGVPNLESLQLPAMVSDKVILTAIGRCKKLRWLSLEGVIKRIGNGNSRGGNVGVGNGFFGGQSPPNGFGFGGGSSGFGGFSSSPPLGGRSLLSSSPTASSTSPSSASTGSDIVPGLVSFVIKNTPKIEALRVGRVFGFRSEWVDVFKDAGLKEGVFLDVSMAGGSGSVNMAREAWFKHRVRSFNTGALEWRCFRLVPVGSFVG